MSFADKIWLYLLGGQYPTDPGYTILDGFVSGEELRCESFSGGEMWVKATDLQILCEPCRWGFSDKEGRTGFILKDFKPFENDGKIWSVSPIQKKSMYGWLRCNPDAYWFWDMKRLQGKDENGNFIPGTEDGFCYRKFPSWRVDFASTTIDGVKRNWIASGGHLSFHKYD